MRGPHALNLLRVTTKDRILTAGTRGTREFESLAVEALVHLAVRTLGKLRQVGDRSSGDAREHIKNVLCVGRADQEVIDMLHREQFSGRGRGRERERRKCERGKLTHPANLDQLDDTDSDESEF